MIATPGDLSDLARIPLRYDRLLTRSVSEMCQPAIDRSEMIRPSTRSIEVQSQHLMLSLRGIVTEQLDCLLPGDSVDGIKQHGDALANLAKAWDIAGYNRRSDFERLDNR